LALPLYERALDPYSQSLVRLTEYDDGLSAGLTAIPIEDSARSLLPSRSLEPGEQYRFHFNMTRCIGCRSCEVACNEQNGNPATIQWRHVGEIEGGTYPDTLRHYLSMGCNHCLDAECMKGCPVEAYTKDPVTGIVLHSADACIGCQYCVWNCPYSVPQFNPARGVVGKCDMCKGRLEEDLEPACVNACPEAAIEIEIVNIAEWRSNYSQAESPGLPAAVHTISTTRITLPEVSDIPLERVDAGHIRPEHSHLSLVFMTTMMQGVVGTLLFGLRAPGNFRELLILLCITSVALGISTMHLGRPAFAWRALRMWRRSWVSREVLLFTVFFGALTVMTVTALRPHATGRLHGPVALFTVALGILATLASSFIYLLPARPSWNLLHTPLDFLISAGLLGSVASGLAHTGSTASTLALASAWILNQAVRLYRLRTSTMFELRSSYNLLTSDALLPYLYASFGCVVAASAASITGHPIVGVLLCWAGLLAGRYLFFVSVVPLKMGLTFLQRRHA